MLEHTIYLCLLVMRIDVSQMYISIIALGMLVGVM